MPEAGTLVEVDVSETDSPQAESDRGDVVVIGGGYAGLSAAHGARQARAERVLIVDDDARHDLYPRLAPISAGERGMEGSLPLARLTTGLVKARATRVRPGDRTIETSTGETIAYGALVVAAGARARLPDVPGLSEHALVLDSADDAEEIARRVAESERVVVIGGGATGIELAGAASERLDCGVVIVEMEERLLPGLDERYGHAAARQLAEAGVEVECGRRLTRVTPSGAILDDEQEIEGPVVWAGGYAASGGDFFDDPPTRKGRLEVDEHLRVAGIEGVFAAGDISAATDKDGQVLPMNAQIAVQAGHAAGKNAARDARGRRTQSARLRSRGFLIPTGHGRGVGRLGPIPLTGALGSRLIPLLHEIVDRRHLLRAAGWRAALRGGVAPSEGGD